ncbi:hypothetical protein QTP88_011379 [Uroleucon formosanum]
MCHKKEIIPTEPQNSTLLSINLAIVSSAVNTGQGYSQIQQFSAMLNMPCLSNPLYQKLHQDIRELTHKVVLEACEEATKEEARLAVENGIVNKDGVPMIAGCIVGYRTKKVLYLGVRNKYCSIYHKADDMQKPPEKHVCYKNWSGTSTAMKADIIFQGFVQSLKTNNLIYSHLIGDGDSSVFLYKKKNDTNINLVPEMQECGIWNDIIASINLVSYHSESLVYHVNNNAVESYNSIMAKYIGGKRINFSFRGMLVDLIERDDLFWKGKMEISLSEFYLNPMI